MKNKLITKIYETGHVKDSRGREVYALGSAVPSDQGMAIYSLVRQTKSQRTLEVGMAYGLSALFACEAHADNNMGGVHTAIDPKQSEVFESIGLLNIERAGLERNFRFFEACSFEIMPQLLEQSESFDFIFIDGMHVFDFTLVDFFFADLLLRPNGYIMFDDLWMPSVRKVVMYILRNRHYRLDPQWIWKPRSLQRRLWDFIRTGRGRKLKTKLMLKHQMRRPFDFSAAYFALKGNLKYQVLQKMAKDDRPWDHHREF
jgi:predicted O-methyltransferase YrrM